MTFNELAVFYSIIKTLLSRKSDRLFEDREIGYIARNIHRLVTTRDVSQIHATKSGSCLVDVSGQTHKSLDEPGDWRVLYIKTRQDGNRSIVWEIDQASVTDEPWADKVVATQISTKELINNPYI